MALTFENVMEYYYKNPKFSDPSDISCRNLNPIKKWLKDQLKQNTGKNNDISSLIRKEGNKFYKEKSLTNSLKSYNSSMCYAQESSEEYFLALANRSAATFELERYEDCLKDVNLCLDSPTYPMNLRPKLYSRKDECLKKLDKISNTKNQFENDMAVKTEQLPLFENGENPNYAYAAPAIELRFNEEKGRHVVAKQTIKKGDTLFIEKAFAFGPIFDEHSRTMHMLKCHECLNDIYCGVPCRYCAKCIFCNSKCRDKSWEESHKWECRGMFGDIWYHLGIAYPAFRALLKGINSTLQTVELDNIKCFGDKEDNYSFFNSLLFDKDNKYLDASVNNSSIIEHWIEGKDLPSDKEPVACGIFPSVSIMNHSCKPNITNYFVCDTIVVKALEDIKKDEEICNCYGICYRNMNKIERQQNCSQLYHFKCNCVICSDPSKEMDVFDVFICTKCGNDIPKVINKKKIFLCQNCGTKVDNQILIDIYQNIELEEEENGVESLLNSLTRKKKLLNRYHSSLQKTCFKLYLFYKEIGNTKCMLKYFKKWLKIEKFKVGQDIQLFGFLLYEVGSFLFSKASTVEDKQMLDEAKNFLAEAKHICELHYPPYITHRI
ncbi:SET and MYND domain-containing protein 4-like isoform X2 [Harmonia axyridis]|uniref:SET and MYND domain-containing protein 4-like isoform X2 n=1 Tax=Harmonia axyridis TaxID=115357 RepID=UPI001E275104|nr:SET and MYND domain-containing protein 4-like isoform X2 [Harmonia axyridis]